MDSFVFFPNFMLLVWAPGWYLTYHYWPTSYNTHIFEGTLYFVPPKNATERLRQELAAVTFKEYALQDGNTLEATQTMIESRAVHRVPLNDQEILLRHLHKTARGYVADYQQSDDAGRRSSAAVLSEEIPMTTSCPPNSPTSSRSPTGASRTEAERYAKRLSSSMDEMQAFYDAAFPRLEEVLAYLDEFELDYLPDDAGQLLLLCYSLVNVSFPVEVWRQARVPDSGAASMDADRRARRLSRRPDADERSGGSMPCGSA